MIEHAAHTLLTAGFSVIPTGANKKASIPWAQFQARQMTTDQAKQHFANAARLAIIGGKVSGNLECLDFDDPTTYQPFLNLLEMHCPGLPGKLLKRQTPSGGYHLVYRSCALVAGNLKLACNQAGEVRIETRGEGGYFLSPPSEGYKVIFGSMTECPTLTTTEVEAIHITAKAFDLRESTKEGSGPRTSSNSDAPGNQFNQAHTVADLLRAKGWKEDRRTTSGQGWTRPGKDSDTSGVLLDDTGNFYVFSSNAHPLESGQSYSAFGLFTMYNHGGDFSAAAKALSGERLGEHRNREATPEAEPEAPILFDEIDTPDISPALLPGWLGEYVDAVARQTQTPPAMAVMLALSTVATCTAKRFDVSPFDGYHEPLNIWTATALPPASRKTAVVSAITAPLDDWEKSEAVRLAPEIMQIEITRRNLRKRINKLEKDAANTEEPPERAKLIREIAQHERDMPEELHAPQLWTGDTTPERLQSLLVDHNERMAVLTDEGGIFEIMAGLYNDGRANLDIFLQGHAGKAVRVDRQSRTAHLDAPALSFGLAIQPAILADFGTGGKRRFRGNGTLARFLFAVPRSNIGKRDVRATYQIPAPVAARYHAGLLALLEISPQIIDGREFPRKLALTPEALDSWQAFAAMIEQLQGTDGDLETIQDWSGKLPGAALRIAGNFHLVEHGGNPPAHIAAATIEKSLDLCALLIDHAKAAFAMMEADQTTADAKAVCKWIVEGHLAKFKTSELWGKFKGRFTGKPDRLEKVLRELQTRHIITAGTEQTLGRTAKVFIANPLLWAAV